MYIVRFILLSLLLLSGIAVAQDAKMLPLESTALTPERAALKVELETIFETDQQNRQLLSEAAGEKERAKLWAGQTTIDKANQVRIEEIVKKYGWPNRKELGPKASTAVFLVIQHSNLNMMKRYMPMLVAAMETDDAWKGSYAMLDDRIRMNEGRPQLYGSQLQVDRQTGKLVLWKIEDEANVDRRRVSMGLTTLAENLKRFNNVDYVPYADRVSKPTTDKVENSNEKP